LADVLFGDYNPAGRLPVTFYKSVDQLPPFSDYSMKGRTYRFFQGEPLFRFGYGLSYTTFAYRNLRVPQQAGTGEEVKVSVEVENAGSRAGEEVVQLYTRSASLSLQGFQRIALRPRERRTVEFTLPSRQLAQVTADGRRLVQPGEIEISVGGGQPGAGALSGKLQLTGSPRQVE
jgi:beta-glucosidase